MLLLVAGALFAPSGATGHGASSPGTTEHAAAQPAPPATCIVHSLPSFVAQGEFATSATVADVIEVECDPFIYGTGSEISVTASQLFSRCGNSMTWYVPNPFREVSDSRSINLALDADGNATVALIAGPKCQAGESLITVHQLEQPFESFATAFTVLPPNDTEEGVFAMPAEEVEDSDSSAVATIIEAEFTGNSEGKVRIGSEELYSRCRNSPKLHWITEDYTRTSGVGEVNGLTLDNNGNVFVLAIGDSSCYPGTSLIEADLETKPFTTLTGTFTILPPQPTAEPAFTIEKLQMIDGSGQGFTAALLTGAIGQTVDYQIVVTNTSNVNETLSELTDPKCDAGTIGGGATKLAPGASTTFTCTHLLTAVGAYTNTGSITATTAGGFPLTQESNTVEVNVPEGEKPKEEPKEEPKPPAGVAKPGIVKLQRIGGGGTFTTETLEAAAGSTVEYEIVVTNEGNTSLTITNFDDPHCDAGTITGGQGQVPLAPGAKTTYTCSHVLAAQQLAWENVAHTTFQGLPTVDSNTVKVNVPQQFVLCEKAAGLKGVSGPKRKVFTASVSSHGIAKVTFYLDGKKLKTLSQKQAKHGLFSVKIDPRKLRRGAHHVAIKEQQVDPACATSVVSNTFVRPAANTKAVHFTG